MAEIEETVYTDETVYTTEVIVDAGSAGHEVVLADMDNVRAHHMFSRILYYLRIYEKKIAKLSFFICSKWIFR